jgi:hypothetical protein
VREILSVAPWSKLRIPRRASGRRDDSRRDDRRDGSCPAMRRLPPAGPMAACPGEFPRVSRERATITDAGLIAGANPITGAFRGLPEASA